MEETFTIIMVMSLYKVEHVSKELDNIDLTKLSDQRFSIIQCTWFNWVGFQWGNLDPRVLRLFCQRLVASVRRGESVGVLIPLTSVTKQGPLEQTVAKCSRIFVQIRISNELNKITLGCKADQTAEIVR